MNRPRHPGQLTGLAILMIAATFTLISCEDFFGAEDLKQIIREDVAAANAESVMVTLFVKSASMGTLSKSIDKPKVGIPFSISTTVGGSYVFVGWSHNSPNATDVEFEDITSETTMVTIYVPSEIIITATFEKRPEVIRSEERRVG